MPQLATMPLLNGVAPSWADVSARVSKNGAPLFNAEDLKELNTGVSISLGVSRSGGRKRRRTTGSADPTASIVLYRTGYQKMARVLSAAAPFIAGERRLSLVHFDIAFQHIPPIEPGSPIPLELYEVRVVGARIIDRQFNDAEGDEANEVSLTLDVMNVYDIIDGQKVTL